MAKFKPGQKVCYAGEYHIFEGYDEHGNCLARTEGGKTVFTLVEAGDLKVNPSTPDANGYDPGLSYTIEDNPMWDGTDAAHPAWWRGEKSTVQGVARQLAKILGMPETSTYQEVREKLRADYKNKQ